MGIEGLRSEIQRRALEAERSILAEAEREAERIVSEAKVEVERIRLETLASKQRELDERERKELAIKRVECGKRIADLRHGLTEAVFEEAEAMLEKIAGEKRGKYRYGEKILDLIGEAAGRLGGDHLIISVNARDRKVLKGGLRDLQRDVSGRVGRDLILELDDGTIDCIGGAMVRTADGRKHFNNTIDARLLKCRNEMRWHVAQTLFEGGTED